jgi:hypothetical protein
MRTIKIVLGLALIALIALVGYLFLKGNIAGA